MINTDFTRINKKMKIGTKHDDYHIGKPDDEMVRRITSMRGLPFRSGRILTLEKNKILQIQIVPMWNGQRFWQSPAKVRSISIEKD